MPSALQTETPRPTLFRRLPNGLWGLAIPYTPRTFEEILAQPIKPFEPLPIGTWVSVETRAGEAKSARVGRLYCLDLNDHRALYHVLHQCPSCGLEHELGRAECYDCEEARTGTCT